MKPLSLLVSLALAIVALVCVANTRTARKALAAQAAERLSVSNQLVQAKAQLEEKEAAVQTLRVQQGLLMADLTSLSNRVNALTRDLADQKEQVAAARQAVAGREAELRGLQARFQESRERGATLERQIEALKRELEVSHSELEARRAELAALNQRLNLSESAHAALLQKWNDPAALRAQAATLTREMTPLAGAAAPRQRPPLVLHPDGSITTSP